MGINQLETTNFSSWQSQKMQSNVENYLSQLNSIPFLNGNFIKNIALSAAAVNVNHGLGRIPQGFIITKRNAGFVVFNGNSDKNFINLTASGNVTVDIWIF